jgi:hypothetical protein
MAFTKANSLTITSGAPSGNTIYEAINYTDLNIDGVITDLNTMDKRAPEYNIIWVPATAMTALTTAGAEGGSTEYATSDDVLLNYYAFDTTPEEYVGFSITMPENWDRSTLKAKFYWAPGSSACSAGNTVEWQIQAISLSNDDNIDTTEFTDTGEVISDVVLTDKNLEMHVTSATPAVTVNGTPGLGDLVYFKISRNTGGTDDMGYDAWLFGVAIQYRMTNTVVAW